MDTTNHAHSLALFPTVRPDSRLLELAWLLGFNVLLIGSAYLSIPLPFSPVPVTGQTFAVLLVAMALGRVRATGVVLAYLLEGIAGLPVFAGGSLGIARLAGPTGGYLLGFLLAAYIVGSLADRGWDRTLARSLASMIAGTVVIFLCGLTQLSLYVPRETLLASGLWPFVPGAILKITVASVILPGIWRVMPDRKQERHSDKDTR
ncbi:MAG: biotin transporter BioY [Candidatus Zixiibacteriota bacterium]|nr:MAG: biotin transporter BioY [candidate division Zixibacteria bacterium]